MTVFEAQARITSREFAEWQAFDLVEPFGDPRADFRAGVIAAASVNTWRKRGEAVKPTDFIPDYAGAAAKALEIEAPPPGGGRPMTDRERDLEFIRAIGARRLEPKG